MAPEPLDQSKVDAFVERIFSDLNSGMTCLTLYIGHRMGLFRALADAGPVSSEELAQRVGLAERYVREWLSALTAGGYVQYDPSGNRFMLPAEHVAVLLDPDNPSYALGVVSWVPSFAKVLPQLMEAFRTGGGVPYVDYGFDMVDAQGLSTRPMFMNDYVRSWLPAMPDIESRLKAGGRVIEVGCGMGWSSIALAKGIPSVRIDAVDPDKLSIQEARRNAQSAGVGDRIAFHEATIEEVPVQGPYDLVTAFECVHDMPYPVSALRRMRELASPAGAVLIADEKVNDNLEDNVGFMGHLFYNFSVLHCLPQAMAFPNAAGTGTVITPATLRRYAEEAGFQQLDVLPIENFQFRFYRLSP